MATGGSGHDIMFLDKREARVVKTFSENPEGESRFEVFLEQISLIFNDFFLRLHILWALESEWRLARKCSCRQLCKALGF